MCLHNQCATACMCFKTMVKMEQNISVHYHTEDGAIIFDLRSIISKTRDSFTLFEPELATSIM